MKRLLIVILTFSMVHKLAAQNIPGVVRGLVQDSVTALPGATVSIIKAKDSSLLSYTLTTSTGFFEIKKIDTGSYMASISYQGFQTLRKPFVISKQAPVVNLGILRLNPIYKTLDEVVVKDAPPIKVNGDTIAFNANAFKTKPDATAEELLKKLPGIRVDRDGTINTQGETVQKVYVDGKEFFGNDPKVATKNITADMIDEVQVYNDVSDQSRFNKIDDGSRSKAINLKLKKDKKRGLFGQAGAGAGTSKRYNAGGRVNQFQGNRRLSLLANSNNINRPGFSTSDLAGNTFSGGRGSNAGGFITSKAFGINYNDSWNTKVICV